ncbi:hypothetical protein CO038_00090 [Candidatus Pacearchaeota archaeon CG_4_9_14_0_2_um_filter_39_13]|nr:DUF5367 domain-containing protein [Candidatus Pacearchaeota archaeon]OIO43573.1 MAG: hypothetical protein AUJ64_02155 [Candidatus Pacearchaeota archaeon CG1_02_39_14]PJC45138.1 MAG: hypothetical protein CO038_00090 [Candidatus Pacearchaeota archaeon CG_4_9_14_0_2_um_filter_39_13]
MKKEAGDNSFGVASVVLGILSILSLSVLGIILGAVGLVFSLKQKKVDKNKWSKAGMILNLIGIVLGILVIIFFFNYASSYLAQIQNLQGGY